MEKVGDRAEKWEGDGGGFPSPKNRQGNTKCMHWAKRCRQRDEQLPEKDGFIASTS